MTTSGGVDGDNLDDLEAAIERAITEVERPGVRSTLPEESSYRCLIDYLGAYALWDMPSGSLGPQPRDLEAVEDVAQDADELPVVDRENDPPIVDVWS